MIPRYSRKHSDHPGGYHGSTSSPKPAARPLAPHVVIGLGNEIASDDGVGIRVAQALRSVFWDRADVDVVALPWAGFALLDVLRGRRSAALVDCLISGRHPAGAIVRLDLSGYAGSVRLNSFHDISYATVMALGRTMGWEMPEEVAIWGIEAGVIDRFGEALSPEVADAIPGAVRAVADFISARTVPSAQPIGEPA